MNIQGWQEPLGSKGVLASQIKARATASYENRAKPVFERSGGIGDYQRSDVGGILRAKPYSQRCPCEVVSPIEDKRLRHGK